MSENMYDPNESNIYTETLNPWISIWTKPRATIRQILDSKSQAYINILAMVGGIATALDKASEKNYGDTNGVFSILIMAIFGGAIGGLITLYIGSALIYWTGKWIGGQGEYDEIKVAAAWANVPLIWGLLLWIPTIALYGSAYFSSGLADLGYSMGLSIFAIILSIIAVILGVWSFIIQLKCLGEAQRFSAWKALGNMILSFLIIIVPILLLVVLLSAF
ncbi:Yip1 family protein [Anaerosolibacter sp.]|uniref:Yip1 family protein n=1 Tax=Anaerosolibacter sp. TaxID=1872527 RepID=UPI0039EF4B55